MDFDTIMSWAFLGLGLVCLLIRYLSTRINWPMIYFKLCGGMKDDNSRKA